MSATSSLVNGRTRCRWSSRRRACPGDVGHRSRRRRVLLLGRFVPSGWCRSKASRGEEGDGRSDGEGEHGVAGAEAASQSPSDGEHGEFDEIPGRDERHPRGRRDRSSRRRAGRIPGRTDVQARCHGDPDDGGEKEGPPRQECGGGRRDVQSEVQDRAEINRWRPCRFLPVVVAGRRRSSPGWSPATVIVAMLTPVRWATPWLNTSHGSSPRCACSRAAGARPNSTYRASSRRLRCTDRSHR